MHDEYKITDAFLEICNQKQTYIIISISIINKQMNAALRVQ